MRVLVVDDSADMRELLMIILRMVGHDAEAVEDGERALARLREARFDAVLLDLVMPGMGGLGFLQAFRCLNRDGRVSVIVTSASPDHLTRLATTVGVDAVLPRPFDVADLLARFADAARPPPEERECAGR